MSTSLLLAKRELNNQDRRWNTLELRFLQAATAADGYAHWASYKAHTKPSQ